MSSLRTAQDVKHYLHDKVFHPNKERILGFIQVSKTEPSNNPLKKKKENVHYLCLYVTAVKPYKAFVARFIKSEGEGDFERRRQWDLDELTTVEGKKIGPKCTSFELHFGAPFKFEALKYEDKAKFIDDIAEACKKYLDKPPPEFHNVNSQLQQIMTKTALEKSQLQKTREELEERGEKLADVSQNTADMAKSAEKFAENAHKLAARYQ